MNSAAPSYRPQLDALRAGAVLAVMMHHWTPGVLGFPAWGDLGVRCFFVLSGFLITGILLRARALVEAGHSSSTWQMRQFYIRRSLRIFPVYYLTLLGAVILGIHVVRESFWWHASYSSNFYFAWRGKWQGCISHLWSLSVEEQFYLLWPALVLWVPRRGFPAVFVASLVGAVATRAGLAATLGPGHVSLIVVPFCCLDSLVMGAALAWLFAHPPYLEYLRNVLLRRRFPWVIGLFAGVCGWRWVDSGNPVLAVVGPFLEALFFAGIIGHCALGVSGWMGRLLNFGPLQYLGRISYGLYLFHLFAEYVAIQFLTPWGFTVPHSGFSRFGIYFLMTLTGAAVSQRWIERPFLAWKRWFPSEPTRDIPQVRMGGPVMLGGAGRRLL